MISIRGYRACYTGAAELQECVAYAPMQNEYAACPAHAVCKSRAAHYKLHYMHNSFKVYSHEHGVSGVGRREHLGHVGSLYQGCCKLVVAGFQKRLD